MQNDKDIRWKQRFSNFEKAYNRLSDVLESAKLKKLNQLEKEGLIKIFEYTYEFAWNTLKDFLIYQGFKDIIGSRDAIRVAFREEIIEDGEVWIQMLVSRNLTTHIYSEELADEIFKTIKDDYYSAFRQLRAKLQTYN